MRRIAVFTSTRADYGILKPLLDILKASPRSELHLIAGGAHLSQTHGHTLDEIEADGFVPAAEIDMGLDAEDGPASLAAAMGRAMTTLGPALERLRPDVLVLLGDRYELLAAAVAAMLFRVPIAHLHGGEATFGAMDEAVRHAVAKMAHLHFPAASAYARRLVQMGEEAQRVFTAGSLAIDAIRAEPLEKPEPILAELDVGGEGPLLLVTYHPVTLMAERGLDAFHALLGVLEERSECRVVFTGVNADTHGSAIAARLADFVESAKGRAAFRLSLGHRRYRSLVAHAAAVVGNSSSGIIEAPVLGTPSVNIGPRQAGRLRAPSVIDCGEDRRSIAAALEKALSPAMQEIAARRETPYGSGNAAETIARVLETADFDGLLIKRFADLPAPLEGAA